MGDEQDHEVLPGVGDVGEHRPHRRRGLDVEGRERLVEQQRVRLGRECEGERHPGGLPPGELTGPAAGEVAHPHDAEPVLRRGAGLPSPSSQAAGPEGDVVTGVQVGEERRRLAEQGHPAPVRGHVGQVAPGEGDPRRVRAGEPRDDREQRGLAGAVRAGDRVPPGGQVEVDGQPPLPPPHGQLQAHVVRSGRMVRA